MNSKYIILSDKSENASKSAAQAGIDPKVGHLNISDAGSYEPPSPIIETAELTEGEAVDIVRAHDVIGIAEAISISLVQPVESTEESLKYAPSWHLNSLQDHGSSYDGTGVVVAVLDTGIDADHEAFAGVEILHFDHTGLGNHDANGHGTHCAGTIFGRPVDGIEIGVATGVTKAASVKVLDDKGFGSSEALFSGLHDAVFTAGANVVSLSLSFDSSKSAEKLIQAGWPTDIAISRSLKGLADNIQLFQHFIKMCGEGAGKVNQGSVFLAASGNSSRRDLSSNFTAPSAFPACLNGVISCAALGIESEKLHVAAFSNSEPTLSAPGVGILSARSGGGVSKKSGTSMACPFVAGFAARWWQEANERNLLAQFQPQYVTSQLISSARKDNILNYSQISCGYGLVCGPS